MMRLVLIPAILVGASCGVAQERQPLSPPAQTSVTISGKTITIKYAAPSMRGRKIFGGLEPYNKVWRAGANSATALHTDADLDLNGLAVPKGDYTVFVWLDHQDRDLGRVKMNMGKPAAPIETYKMTLSATGQNTGKLQLEWENTIAWVPFTVK